VVVIVDVEGEGVEDVIISACVLVGGCENDVLPPVGEGARRCRSGR